MKEGYFKDYYEKNKDRMKQQHSRYYHAHREEILERIRKQREENPEEAKAKWKEYYAKNKLRIKMRRDAHKDEVANV
jgi:hypothetical protein